MQMVFQSIETVVANIVGKQQLWHSFLFVAHSNSINVTP